MPGRVSHHMGMMSEKDDWITPRDIYLHACDTYDIRPVIDVCASSGPTVDLPHMCAINHTKEDDSLGIEWDNDFFMNPPYGKQISTFMEKAWVSHQDYNVNGLILTFAKTDTRWWHDFVEGIAEVHFIKGRIRFIDPETGVRAAAAPYPSCWIIYRRDRSRRRKKARKQRK